MTFDAKGALADAWAMWRADRDLLLRIAGLFLFLPQFGILLLLPPMPPLAVTEGMDEAAQRELAQQIVAWASSYGGWYVLGALLVQAGTLVVLMLYLERDRPDLGQAMSRSLRLFPRFLLAMIIVGLPIGLGVLTLILLIPGIYLLGRLLAVGPVLVAEAPISVSRSIARSWALTRGHGIALAGLMAITIFGGSVLTAPFTLLDKSLRAAVPNPVAIAMVDAAAAAVTVAALLATVLIQIAAYRRLVASKGI